MQTSFFQIQKSLSPLGAMKPGAVQANKTEVVFYMDAQN